MRFLITAIVILPLFALTAEASDGGKLSCQDNNDLINSAVTADFDAAAPSFSMKIQPVDADPVPAVEVLSAQNVCGVPLDFAANCKARLHYRPNDLGEGIEDDDWTYDFTCNNGIKGEMTLVLDSLNFHCQGPGVVAADQDNYFVGCKVDLAK